MADKELLTCKSERLSSFLVDTDLIKKAFLMAPSLYLTV